VSSYHKAQVSDLLLSFLSEQLRRLDNPRFKLVTFTAIKMTPDMKVARIYWSVPVGNSKEDFDNVVKGIQTALSRTKNYFKKKIGQELRLRHTPELVFQFDKSISSGFHIDSILDQLKAGNK
jgi:ribosome-binding factor A